ncbi:tetrapyrrole methylase [Dioszegia hungarica]|uniref:precorrin-2 dehydrogenase n=1 Tax=Dioszegia hungarica TaxID=4972 RepID=A0AA38LTG9_9TREE|nr:tetrapyrrole methylase [Dioszegia hungarica]KAI9633344.1 tetrapyrrole methylase [Dioszegia hungarica]
MAPIVRKPGLWVSAWFAFSTIIVLWVDAGYCFNRPRSMPGGDLAWIWAPYNMVPYAAVDYIYGLPSLERGDGFPNAQALMNVFEAILNVEYLYLRHYSSRNSKLQPGQKEHNYHGHAPLVGFAATVMTCSKTLLYFWQDYFCGWCCTGHNSRWLFWTSFVAPNVTWIVVPAIVATALGRFMTEALNREYATQVAFEEHTALRQSVAAPADAKGDAKAPSEVTEADMVFTPIGRTCMVVGHNRLAASRVLSLLEAEADVITASEQEDELSEELRYRIKTGQIDYLKLDPLLEGSGWSALLKSHRVALLCVTDTLIASFRRSARSAEFIAIAASSLNIPLNISDQPRLSTFNFPSVHRFPGIAGPSSLQIAVSTNGNGCRLNARIRRDIVSRLPPDVGRATDPDTPLNAAVPQLDTPSLLNQAAFELRAVETEDEDEQLRRMRWVHQMSEYYSYEALGRMGEGDIERALGTWERKAADGGLPHHEGAVEGASTVQREEKEGGRIYLVGSGPGHPGLLTVAAATILRTATVILSDKLVPAEILALIPKTIELHIAKKFPGNNEGAQNEMMELALTAARRGETVVRLKQGDPFVYGRGGEEVLYFRQNGFECTLIPGVSSALAGPLMMGIPVTQRGVAESLILCTGVGRAGKSVQLPGYVRSRSLALLMGVARIQQIVDVLTNPAGSGRDGAAYPRNLPIAVIERASSPDQRAILSTLEHIEEALKSMEERPPGMMLIGWAVLALEGEGRVDVLDREEEGDGEVVRGWMDGQRWKVREGLGSEWAKLEGMGVVI